MFLLLNLSVVAYRLTHFFLSCVLAHPWRLIIGNTSSTSWAISIQSSPVSVLVLIQTPRPWCDPISNIWSSLPGGMIMDSVSAKLRRSGRKQKGGINTVNARLEHHKSCRSVLSTLRLTYCYMLCNSFFLTHGSSLTGTLHHCPFRCMERRHIRTVLYEWWHFSSPKAYLDEGGKWRLELGAHEALLEPPEGKESHGYRSEYWCSVWYIQPEERNRARCCRLLIWGTEHPICE